MEYILMFLLAYFFPTLNAFWNKYHSKRNGVPVKKVLIINLFLGITVIGWVVALTMSVGKEE